MTGKGPLGQSSIKPSHSFEEHLGATQIGRLDRLIVVCMAIALILLLVRAFHLGPP